MLASLVTAVAHILPEPPANVTQFTHPQKQPYSSELAKISQLTVTDSTHSPFRRPDVCQQPAPDKSSQSIVLIRKI
jgi:hypothetical protein